MKRVRRRLVELWPVPWLVVVLAFVVGMLANELNRANSVNRCGGELVLEAFSSNANCPARLEDFITVAVLAAISLGIIVACRLVIRNAFREPDEDA